MVCPVSVVTGTPGKAVPRIHSWEWLVQLGALLCEPRRQLQFRAGLWWLNKMLHPCLERRKTGVILPFWKIPHFKYKYANVIHCAPFNMLRISGHRKYLGSISVTDIIYISTVNLWIIYGEILKDMPHLLKGCPMFERRLRMGHTEWERSHTEVFVGHKVAEKFPLSELPSQCTAHKMTRVGSGPCSAAVQAMESLCRTSANTYIHSSVQHRLQDNRLVPSSPRCLQRKDEFEVTGFTWCVLTVARCIAWMNVSKNWKWMHEMFEGSRRKMKLKSPWITL